MDLDNINTFKDLDSLKVFESIQLFPEQIKEAWSQAVSSNVEAVKCKSVIISGMGGSSNAGKIIQGLYEGKINIPIHVYNDYGLPAWVDQETLVVLSTYSGNTEETLSSLDLAFKKGAKVVGVTTGGKVAEMIKVKQIPGAIITPTANPTNFPKTALGISFGGLLGALQKSGIIQISESELFLAIEELIKVRDSFRQEAKDTAKWFLNSVPVLFTGRPFLGSLNAGRNVLDEVSRVFTLFYDFPEVDHVLIEATKLPSFITEKFRYLFFVSQFNHERVNLRYKATKEIFIKQGLNFRDYQMKGGSELIQALELPHFCAWVAFYLSMLYGNDPGPEPWIIDLKKSLSQPIH